MGMLKIAQALGAAHDRGEVPPRRIPHQQVVEGVMHALHGEAVVRPWHSPSTAPQTRGTALTQPP